jgi:adenine specific DNA methylase Mod
MTIENDIDANRQKMAGMHHDFSQQIEQIRKDPMRSQLAKDTEITALYRQTKERAEKFRDNEQKIIAKAIDEKERNLFGYGSATDTISRRDADDRAHALEHEDEALSAYQRAMQTSDTTMQRSLALKAHESGWNGVLKKHFEERPTEANMLNELVQLRAYRDNTGIQILTGSHYTVIAPMEVKSHL